VSKWRQRRAKPGTDALEAVKQTFEVDVPDLLDKPLGDPAIWPVVCDCDRFLRVEAKLPRLRRGLRAV
jgi:hypothetical protein